MITTNMFLHLSYANRRYRTIIAWCALTFSWCSFHEMGVHDLPAEIDWVLNVTGHKKLYYIGFSMGTTMSYVMASVKPEYNDKLQFMVSLAPVAFMTHVKSPIRLLVPFVKDLEVKQ